MTTGDILMLISVIVLIVVSCIYYSHCKNKLKSFLISSAVGAVTLVLCYYIYPLLNHSFGINAFTIIVTIAGGAPAVILLAIAAL